MPKLRLSTGFRVSFGKTAISSFFRVSFFLIISALIFSQNISVLYAETAPDSRITDKDLLLYLDVLNKVREKSVFIPPNTQREDIVKDTIRQYLKSLDPFSVYLTPEEYKVFKDTQKSDYAGVGIEVEKSDEDKYIIMPYPSSPAERAGIKFGDILEAVDGIGISGKSLFTIASMIRGKKGTEVLLTVNQKGTRKDIKLIRSPIHSESVIKKQIDDISLIRILSFTPSTRRELRYVLDDSKDAKFLVVDLRDNPGGDLHSAIDSVMLFLEKDKKIVDIKEKNRVKSYKSLNDAPDVTTPLYILQDKQTASAAEVFIAALVQNGRAQSVGMTTYGKGSNQDIIELSDGSALFLTAGYLETPDGTRYHGKGIEPTHNLSSSKEDYLSVVKNLTRKVSSVSPQSTPSEKNKKTGNDIKVTIELSEGEDAADGFYNCFDRKLNNDKDAQTMASVVKKSFDNIEELYIFSEGGIFWVCIGPYKTQEDADQKREIMTRSGEYQMSVKVVKNNTKSENDHRKNNTTISRKNSDRGIRKTFFIQAASFNTRERAESKENQLKTKYSDLNVIIREGSKKYKILIGPFEETDNILLDKLKRKGDVGKDAFWYSDLKSP